VPETEKRLPVLRKAPRYCLHALDRTSPNFANFLMEAARLHGENSEPDHEVGDLQDLFFACWLVMTPEQRALVLSDPAITNLLDCPEYEDIV